MIWLGSKSLMPKPELIPAIGQLSASYCLLRLRLNVSGKEPPGKTRWVSFGLICIGPLLRGKHARFCCVESMRALAWPRIMRGDALLPRHSVAFRRHTRNSDS